jgi:hypothetical protein
VSLVLDHNKIEDIHGIADLKNLQTLWLNHNQISNMDHLILNLRKLRELNSLSLCENPICPKDQTEYQIYRYSIICEIGTLSILDSLKVSKNEKTESSRRKNLIKQQPEEEEVKKVAISPVVDDFSSMKTTSNVEEKSKMKKKVFDANEFSFEAKNEAKGKNFDW